MPLAEITPFLTASDVLLVLLWRDPVFEILVPSKIFDFLACALSAILIADGEAREVLDAAKGRRLPDLLGSEAGAR